MPKLFQIPKSNRSWHFSHDLKPDDKSVIGTFTTIPAGDDDIQKVISAYSTNNINGYVFNRIAAINPW